MENILITSVELCLYASTRNSVEKKSQVYLFVLCLVVVFFLSALGCTMTHALYDVYLVFSFSSLWIFTFHGRNEYFDSLHE